MPKQYLWTILIIILLGAGFPFFLGAKAKHHECPHTVADAITGVTEVSIAGPITDVPEFHDCQRLIIAGNYGPVVAVWVSVRIDSLFTDMFRPLPPASGTQTTVPPGTTGAGAVNPGAATGATVAPPPTINPRIQTGPTVDTARIVADSLLVKDSVITLPTDPVARATMLIARGRAPVAVPVVQLYNFGDTVDVVGNLTLPPGFSCIYLLFSPQAVAFLQHRGSQNSCPGADTGAKPLPMGFHRPKRPGTTLDYADSDYPPVARWEWDSVAHRQVIGVKCGTAWCRIGLPPLKPASHDIIAGSKGAAARVFLVPGWYDEQLLAIDRFPNRTRARRVFSRGVRLWLTGIGKAPHDHMVEPSGLRGTIFPDPELGNRSHADYRKNEWVRIAEVWLSDSSSYYATKFNFKAPKGGGLAAELYLWHKADHDLTDVEEDHDWIVLIKGADGSYMYKKAIWRPTLWVNGEIVGNSGTVRWRWKEDDETTWEYCPAGCCEVEVKFDDPENTPPPPS